MKRTILSTLATAALLISPAMASPLAPQDETAPQKSQTVEIFRKLTKLLDQPFTCEMDLNVTMPEGSGEGSGKLAWSDNTHFALGAKMAVTEAGVNQKADLQIVADGEFVYVDVKMQGERVPMMPMKFSAKLLKKATKLDSLGPGMPGIGDLHAILDEAYKIEKGDSTGELRKMALVARDKGIDGPTRIAVDFDKKSWFPMSINATGERGEAIVLKTSNLKFPESIPASNFVFNVEEGVMVMDMTQMLQMQFGGMDLDDDEEVIVVEEEPAETGGR